ncbi:DUF4387 family protein [Mycobacterium simiae]|uniref:DUF4387 family protein n=1 Tax=Mycobacterium simiae TaxID=1784 RepID=A0A5B1BTR7_MYCSI|nr:DUF4387 family protein [Mycobacterium simiae]
MASLLYRVVSACGALGYGYPAESLRQATDGRVDAIVCDAGSMDAGPFYLGTGQQYFEREAVKADYRHMVQAGVATQAPVIVGSCGMAGGARNLEWMLDVAKEVFAELAVAAAKVAVISSDVDPQAIISEYRAGTLIEVGPGLVPDEAALAESTLVGQMGIHPIITALDAGAQFIFAGRSCDVALFAADMIRKDIDAGLAYHIGHVLECGALACDPGSPSDCLVAEVFDDGTAYFVAPNPERSCTPYSIAAHSLYEEEHPQLQFYPEGVLVMEHTEFLARDATVAGIRGSRFVRATKYWPLSIKLEGSHRVGARRVSLVHLQPADLPAVPDDILVYGRNGVEAEPIAEGERELGLIVETTSPTRDKAVLLASLVTHYLIHYGYPKRRSTAGNIAYPLSPNIVDFDRGNGTFGAIAPSGTRDPVFFENYEMIKAALHDLIERQFPDALVGASYRIIEADASSPVALLRTVDQDPRRLAERHDVEIARLQALAPAQRGSLLRLDAPDAYQWSLFHLLQNATLITESLFKITYFKADGDSWEITGAEKPRYWEIGETDHADRAESRSLSVIAEAPPSGEVIDTKPLLDMAVVIRSKDAGINVQTYDILFATDEDYDAALRSNLFNRSNVASILNRPVEHVIGTYFVGSCRAIKISARRNVISGSIDDRDVFGAQQQRRLEALWVPIYAAGNVDSS